MIPSLSRWFYQTCKRLTKCRVHDASRCHRNRLNLETLEDRTVPSAIQGSLFEDLNGDGNIGTDPSLALAGVTMYLDQNQNGIRDVGEVTTQTNASGAFSFVGLAAGTYRVAQEVPAGWVQTSPAPSYGTGVFGEITRAFDFANGTASGMAWVNGSLYVTDYQNAVIRQHSPLTGQQIAQFAAPAGQAVHGLTYDGASFWGTNIYTKTIFRFDLSGNVYESYTLPDGSQPQGIVWDGSTLWVANVNGSTTIFNIDPADGRVIRSFASPSGEVRGLGFDGTHLWASSPSYTAGESRIFMLDMTTGAVLRSMPAPGPAGNRPFGVSFDGDQLWVQDFESGWIFRVSISDPGQRTVTVDGTNDATGLAFGDFKLGTVSGRVFNDNDQDGTQDAAEGGIPGWRVFIDGNGNGTYETWERSAVTNSLGDYSIGGLRAGTYTVISDLVGQNLSRWSTTTPAAGTQTATVTTSGEAVGGKNFGNFLDRTTPISANEWGRFQGGEMSLYTGLTWGYDSGSAWTVTTFDGANALAADSTRGDFTDWRLPTKSESLAAASVGVATRLNVPPPGNGNLFFWTSTTSKAQKVWVVDLFNGASYETGRNSGVVLVEVRDTGTVIDDGAAGYTTFGFSAKSASGAYQGDQSTATKGTGSKTATWTFAGLEAGATYKVDVTWKVVSGAATNAPFTVLEGNTQVGAFSLNQNVAPNDFTTSESTSWEGLGTYTISGSSLSVKLSNLANGTVIADAVRIFKVFPSYAPAPLLAAGGEVTDNPSTEILTNDQLQPIIAEAISRWQARGISAERLDQLRNVEINIGNLGDGRLGLASGNSIWLDDNAAGYGWFVDSTPGDDSEFSTDGDQGEQGRIDLLTVLMHEMGHLIGEEHEAGGVMSETLATGTRSLLSNDADPVDAVASLYSIDVSSTDTWRGARAKLNR